MTGTVIERALDALELLAGKPDGATLTSIAQQLEIPPSATHRLLSELVRLGYAQQDPAGSAYAATAKVATLGYGWLQGRGIIAVVQPALEELAAATGELVRYAVVDNGRLAWAASAQGARFGLRLEPDMGEQIALHATAAGHAWLACLSDEEALRLMMNQRFGTVADRSSGAPDTIDCWQNVLRLARSKGYANTIESPSAGISALAAPVRHPITHLVCGILDISAPSARLGEARLQQLASELLAACAELAQVSAFITRAGRLAPAAACHPSQASDRISTPLPRRLGINGTVAPASAAPNHSSRHSADRAPVPPSRA